MNNTLNAALDEVIRQFGRQLIERPDLLRAALTDVLLADDNASRALLDAVVAVSETKVVTQIAATGTTPITPGSVNAWLAQLTAVGVSPRDAAIATTAWAQVIAPADAAGEISAITQSLTAQTLSEHAQRPPTTSAHSVSQQPSFGSPSPSLDQTYIASMPGGDETVMGDAGAPPGPWPSSSPISNSVSQSSTNPWATGGTARGSTHGSLTQPKSKTLQRISIAAVAVVAIVAGGFGVHALTTGQPEASRGGTTSTDSGSTTTGSETETDTTTEQDTGNEQAPDSLIAVSKLDEFVLAPLSITEASVGLSASDAYWESTDHSTTAARSPGGIEPLNSWFEVSPSECAPLGMLATPTVGESWTSIQTFFEWYADDSFYTYVISSASRYESEADAKHAMDLMATSADCWELTLRNTTGDAEDTGYAWSIWNPGIEGLDVVNDSYGDRAEPLLQRRCDQTLNVVSCLTVGDYYPANYPLTASINDFYFQRLVSARSGTEFIGEALAACQEPGCEPGGEVGDNVRLDDLWWRCAAGVMGACDDLYMLSSADSVLEEFGNTCGDKPELRLEGNWCDNESSERWS